MVLEPNLDEEEKKRRRLLVVYNHPNVIYIPLFLNAVFDKKWMQGKFTLATIILSSLEQYNR
jgi:hypothetical protein